MTDRHPEDLDPISDYRMLTSAIDWREVFSRHSCDDLHFLDVGCGAGRWLDALLLYNSAFRFNAKRIRYSAIDPSEHALTVIARKAEKYFTLDSLWQDRVESASFLPINRYDVIWSIHSLYALARHKVSDALSSLLSSLRPDGLLVIALAEEDSFYGRALPALTGWERFTCAEDISAALETMGIEFDVCRVRYLETIHRRNAADIAAYVLEESIGNSYPALSGEGVSTPAHLLNHAWLDQFIEGEFYKFPQAVSLITVRSR